MLPRRKQKNSDRQNAGKRSPGHRKWIRGFVCLVDNEDCDGETECAHKRDGTGGGMGVKPSDKWTLPYCRHHHSEQHQIGEAPFEKKYGIDGIERCKEFAKASPKAADLRDMP